ncbi:MAG: gluconate transporter, partial [Chitinophagales bacterium]
GPAGVIILITGAGGVFKQMLIESGAGVMIAEQMIQYRMMPVLLAFSLALIVRLLQGSATVAMITAAGIVGPVILNFGLSEPQLALIVLSIAAGASGFSHVNDSGFWLVNQYLGLTEAQTLRSWTVMTGILAFTALLLIVGLSLVIA